MIPLAKPSREFITCLLMVLKKNTNEAPKAVIAHVPNVARNAKKIGLLFIVLQYGEL